MRFSRTRGDSRVAGVGWRPFGWVTPNLSRHSCRRHSDRFHRRTSSDDRRSIPGRYMKSTCLMSRFRDIPGTVTLEPPSQVVVYSTTWPTGVRTWPWARFWTAWHTPDVLWGRKYHVGAFDICWWRDLIVYEKWKFKVQDHTICDGRACTRLK